MVSVDYRKPAYEGFSQTAARILGYRGLVVESGGSLEFGGFCQLAAGALVWMEARPAGWNHARYSAQPPFHLSHSATIVSLPCRPMRLSLPASP